MIFILRMIAGQAVPDSLDVLSIRATPPTVADGTGLIDFFCAADDAARDSLIGQGLNLVALTDGWYADDGGGGVAVWGAGEHWEVRDTLFTVTSHSGIAKASRTADRNSETTNIRDAILGSVP